jgi:hypothetical protein
MAALATGSPDAELLRLGEQLDRVIADYHAQQLEDRAEREPFEAKVELVTGIARRNAPAWNDESPAAVAYWDARGAVSKTTPNGDDSDADEESPWTHIHDRLYPIVDDILSRRAQTIAGLAVQARAVVMAMADPWDGEGERHERVFIESVCAFVGIAPEQLLLRPTAGRFFRALHFDFCRRDGALCAATGVGPQCAGLIGRLRRL